MTQPTWRRPTATAIVQMALVWIAIYATEVIAAYVVRRAQGTSDVHHVALAVVLVCTLAAPLLGKQQVIRDIQELFCYDALFVIFDMYAATRGWSPKLFLTLVQGVFILKALRIIWPVGEYFAHRQLNWPVFGPIGLIRNWGQPGCQPTATQLAKMIALCLMVSPFAIIMQATLEEGKNPIPYPSIVTLLFTGIVTARLIKNLEAREQEREQALQKLGEETGRAEAAEQYAGELAAQRDEIGRKKIELEEMREKDQQQVQDLAERNESLRNANHDVKQPIHNLRYYAHRLAETASTAEQRALAAALETGLYELSSMIHSTIDQAKISTQLSAPATQALATLDLAQYFHGQFFEHAQARHIYFEQKTHACTVQADVVLLKRVLSNLVNNAVLHSPPATVVQLRFYATADYCMVRVWNRGAVIPDANGPDRPANFATFIEHCKQAENEINTARIPTNHGLGLISVQRLCREMGVTMQLKSRPGLGTVFRFRLPLV